MNLEEDIWIERFLKDELSESEEKDFRERMSSDTEFREKVAFERQLFETLNQEDWSFAETGASVEFEAYKALFQSDEARNINQTISEVIDKHQGTSKVRNLRKWIFYPVAAAITLVAVLFGVDHFGRSSEELYVSYLDKSDLPSFSTRGDDITQKELLTAQSYLNNKQYDKAEPILSNALESGYEDGALYINLAICQMQTQKYDKAESTLNMLIASNLLDGEKGYWYKSLLYLAIGKTDKSKEALNSIIDNSYFNQEAAKELLEELE